MRKHIIAGSLLAVAICWAAAQTSAQQGAALNRVSGTDTTVLMRAKLGSSQKIVEGLMAGDFAAISKGAADLAKICESTAWIHQDDQVVAHYRSQLKKAALRMNRHASEENLEAAMFTYMNSLSTCVRCHEYSRNVLRVAQAPQANSVVRIPVTEQEQQQYQRPKPLIR